MQDAAGSGISSPFPSTCAHPSLSKFWIWAAKLVGNSDASNLVMGITPLLPASKLHHINFLEALPSKANDAVLALDGYNGASDGMLKNFGVPKLKLK